MSEKQFTQQRHYRQYLVSPALLIASAFQGAELHVEVVKSFPEGSKFMEAFYDTLHQCLRVIVEHPSFDLIEVVDLRSIPEYEIKMRDKAHVSSPGIH